MNRRDRPRQAIGAADIALRRPEQEWTGQAAQHRLSPRDCADDRRVFEDYVQRIGATSKEANEKMFEGSGERFVA